ncbi:MAG TPA: hypothetical protein VKX28_01250 [Xanthobacteraceae bacterium]|jgi:hypothetical protein|nr:hypothetical protein [Xanthobacteraceae bacterium]
MVRAAAVALAVLAGFDFVGFGGRYTADMVQILTAIEQAFV